MERWIVLSLLLCTFGLLREIRPSEPYVSEFLLGEWRNITEEALYQDVYPVGTYSYMALLSVILIITDFLKYKPLIVLSGLSGVAVYSILLWTESLEWLQASQFFYGLFMATEIAYYTYMFAKVDKDKYDKVVSYTRSAALVGRFLSGITAQLLISFRVMNFRQLNYITLFSQILATVWALFLPPVNKSIYFHQNVENPIGTESANDSEQISGLKLLWKHAQSAYSRQSVLIWSAWYAASTAAFYQVQYYVQILWLEIEPNQEVDYNGIVEAILTVLGAGASFLFSIKKFNKNIIYSLPIIAGALQAACTTLIYLSTAVWLSYIGYVLSGIIFHYMITLASAQIAHKLVDNSCFGVIFGINTLAALVIQSILTGFLINGLKLSIHDQYMSYVIYYGILCFCGLIVSFVNYYRDRNT